MSNPKSNPILIGDVACAARLECGISINETAKFLTMSRDRLNSVEHNEVPFTRYESEMAIRYFLEKNSLKIWRSAVRFVSISRKLTASELGHLMGVTDESVYNWRHGRHVPQGHQKGQRFEKLREIYDMPTMALMAQLNSHKKRVHDKKKPEKNRSPAPSSGSAPAADPDLLSKSDSATIVSNSLKLDEPASKPIPFLRKRHSGKGDYLRQLRFHMGISMRRMAMLLDCDPRTLAKWERLKGDQPLESIYRAKTIGKNYSETGTVPTITPAPVQTQIPSPEGAEDHPLAVYDSDRWPAWIIVLLGAAAGAVATYGAMLISSGLLP